MTSVDLSNGRVKEEVVENEGEKDFVDEGVVLDEKDDAVDGDNVLGIGSQLSNGSCSVGSTRPWSVCNRRVPRAEVIYFSQILLIYIVVSVCLGNLTVGIEHQSLWASLLSGCLGYILPAPKYPRGSERKKNYPVLKAAAGREDEEEY